MFKAKLAPEARGRLLEEARTRLDPRSPLSEGLQLEMAQAEVLRGWMEAGGVDEGKRIVTAHDSDDEAGKHES